MKQEFEWDANKERLNIRKHGIDFHTALEVFDDPHRVTVQDRFENGEYRWQTVGFSQTHGCLLLLVAHTLDEIEDDEEGTAYEYIRIISARKADRKDKALYGRQKGSRGA